VNGFSTRWLSLIIGLVIGLALGLVYTWVISPVELTNTYPALLRTDYRRDWVRLTALSYVADSDLGRTRSRLDGLEHEDIEGALEALIDEYAAAGRPADTMRRLTALANALDVHTPAMLVYLYTPTRSAPTHTPSPTPTPAPVSTATPTPTIDRTATPKPTRTPRIPTPTPSSVLTFDLVEQEQVCKPGQASHIEVVVRDERGQELPGVEIWLMWPGGADRAVTGLKPQSGAGYADFDAEPDVDYSIGTSELGMPLVTGLQIEPCPERKGKEPMLGTWRIALERRLPATSEPET
jgi:hypothetical protein